jgi:carbon storage regulator
MLVLSRRESERIVIDGQITVSIVKVRGKVVRLGIEAPPDVPIRRETSAAGKKAVAA